MIILIETPKGSFTKYKFTEGKFKPELKTPFPSPFNYGYTEEETAGDKQPRDAIVLGPKAKQGAQIKCRRVGLVLFKDDNMEDNKIIGKTNGSLNLRDKIQIHAFFTAYMLYKTLHYITAKRKLTYSRYQGLKTE